jgi:homoserine O-acetyltransferase/O-succinyltransferase
MNAWEWAEAYPDAMDGIMPVACFPSPITGRNLLWRRMVVDGIKADPAWAAGAYRQEPPSLASGLQILRLMIDGVPHLQAAAASRREADNFIAQVKRQADELDANDLVYSLESSSDYDAEPGRSRVKAKAFALNFADDEFYRDSLQTLQQDIPKVTNGRLVVRAVSDGSAGHLSMAHPALWADEARAFMAWLGAT